MGKQIDITNQRFGRLIALKKTRKDSRGSSIWLFKCDCGNKKEILLASVRTGRTKSCGCLRKAVTAEKNTIHGKSSTRLYKVWKGIRGRCNNPKHKSYKYYGARGIKICKRWDKFKNFYDDMIIGSTKGLSLDRINNDEGYSAKNCRWVTHKKQMRNTRRNKMITLDNRTQCLSAWVEETGKSSKEILIQSRLYKKQI